MHEQFKHIDINLIDEDISNHRLVTDPTADAELEQSIIANGIQQPVKLCKKDDGRYTLVWGFRRKAAATRAGISTVPAIIVEGLTASQIRALQAIENLERKELHPLEEAQFCADLADTIGNENASDRIAGQPNITEAIAQRIGRSTKWVENRLAMARLSERVKQCFIDGDIHLQHINLIARLAAHDAQEEVLGQVKAQVPAYYLGGSKEDNKKPPATIAETRHLVEQRLRDLSDAPWKLDAEFDNKPACLACPHNSANRLELFHDDAPQKPQCLLASCHAEKTKIAGRAIQRATNTAIKTAEENTGKAAGKPTKTQVEAAIAERAVSYIHTEAVIASTKRRQDPKEKTQGEAKGEKKSALHEQARRELWQRQRIWRDNIISAIDEKLQPGKNPIAIAVLMLIYNSGIIDIASSENSNEKTQKAALTKLNSAISILTKTVEPGEKLNQALQALKSFIVVDEYCRLDHLSGSCSEDDDFVLEKIAASYKIEYTPAPTVESIEAELLLQEQAA